MTSAPTASYSPVSSQPDLPARRQGFGHLMLAEWTKIRSVRSTAWTLVLFVVITIGLTALFSWVSVRQLERPACRRQGHQDCRRPGRLHLRRRHRARPADDLRPRRPGDHDRVLHGSHPGLAAGRAQAVPDAGRQGRGVRPAHGRAGRDCRVRLVLQSARRSCITHVAVSLSGTGVLRATLGAGLYLTVLGLFALAIGALIRHTAGAISIVIGVVLVLPDPDRPAARPLVLQPPQRLPAAAGGVTDLRGAPEQWPAAHRVAGLRGALHLDRALARAGDVPARPPRRVISRSLLPPPSHVLRAPWCTHG